MQSTKNTKKLYINLKVESSLCSWFCDNSAISLFDDLLVEKVKYYGQWRSQDVADVTLSHFQNISPSNNLNLSQVQKILSHFIFVSMNVFTNLGEYQSLTTEEIFLKFFVRLANLILFFFLSTLCMKSVYI